MKKAYDHELFLKALPSGFKQFLDHISKLKYEDKPDYKVRWSTMTVQLLELGHLEKSFKTNQNVSWEQRMAIFSYKPMTLKNKNNKSQQKANKVRRYEYTADHRSYVHNLSSCEIKPWKKEAFISQLLKLCT